MACSAWSCCRADFIKCESNFFWCEISCESPWRFVEPVIGQYFGIINKYSSIFWNESQFLKFVNVSALIMLGWILQTFTRQKFSRTFVYLTVSRFRYANLSLFFEYSIRFLCDRFHVWQPAFFSNMIFYDFGNST